jgi:hypothetical protein
MTKRWLALGILGYSAFAFAIDGDSWEADSWETNSWEAGSWEDTPDGGSAAACAPILDPVKDPIKDVIRDVTCVN